MAQPLRFVSAACLATIAACQSPPDSTAVPVTETFRDFGEYVMHFNALTTDQLTAEIAQRHGIVRSNNRAMLNVSILRKRDGSLGVPVAARVTVSANNLTGQLKNVTLKEVREAEAIYYLAESAVANGETLIYAIDAIPESQNAPLSIRYRKQFFLD